MMNESRDQLIIMNGSKKEFTEWVNASNNSDNWTHRYDDYDCYKTILGEDNLHMVVAKTIGICLIYLFNRSAEGKCLLADYQLVVIV